MSCVLYLMVTVVFLAVITRVRGYSFKTCDLEEWSSCSKPLSGIMDSGLTYFSSKPDLDMLCPDLKEALRCIHAYTRLCMNLHRRKHFRKLFHDTNIMITELCSNSTFQEEYLKHASCMQSLQTQNQICFDKYAKDITSIQLETDQKVQIKEKVTPDQIVTYAKRKREAADMGIRSVCCSFQEYTSCSTRTVERSCGNEAAEFSKFFMERMSSAMIKNHCHDYTPEKCGILPSSSTSISSSLISLSAITFLSFLFR
ncbi:uncharacterized protein LOC108740451 [Agrilus planipennis]|uniref:Uncharacterized protein LOC108740451 n=1 Tax=Agrilus planipennis TaxID=224129 RepID=A0A1W4XCX0_AGRPL|nr:uncharacterized protein LOC108740451 [Agrilus planipennis]